MAYISKLDLRIKNQKLITTMKYLTFLTVMGIFLFSMNACSLEYTQDEMDSALDFKDAQFQHLLNATNEEIKALEDVRDALTDKVDKLTLELNESNLENESLREDIVLLNELNAELSYTIDLLNAKNLELTTALALSQENVDLLEIEVASLKVDVSILTAEVSTLAEELEYASNVILMLRADLDLYQSYVVSLNNSLSGMSSNNADLQAEIDALKLKVSSKVDTISRLRQRIINVKARNYNKLNQLLTLADRMSDTPWQAYFALVNRINIMLGN